MNRSRKKTYTLIVIGTLLFSGLLYAVLFFTVIKPLQLENNQVEQELTLFKNVYEKNVEQAEDVGDLEVLNNVLLRIPNKKAPDSVLALLSQLASETNVTIAFIESIEGAESTTEEAISTARYSVEVDAGTIQEMNAFIDSMLESNRLVIVDTIDLIQNQGPTNAVVTFTTFYTND